MMRRTMAGVVLAAGLAFSSFSNAHASGYPVLSIVTSSGSTSLMVGRFSNASFSFQQADAYAAFVASLLAGQSAETYIPSQLTAMGYGDATALINMLYSYYQSMGFSSMVYFNVTRVAGMGGAYGVSDRIDIYVANLSALSGGALPGDYVASFEFPEGYLGLL